MLNVYPWSILREEVRAAMTTTPDVMWMTPTALEGLRAELAALTTPARELLAAERARVVELRDLVNRAEVQSKPDDGLVEPGMRIAVRSHEDDATFEFVLGSRALLSLDDSLDVAVYSPDSPLGAAINGLSVGDTAVVSAPKGQLTLTILGATPVG
jgi:transcription elongation factor GreA